jgi:hypothetical protein
LLFLLSVASLVVGCWLLVVGCWLLVVGCWLLVVGCWLLFDKTFKVYSPFSCFCLSRWNNFFVVFLGSDALQGKCLLATSVYCYLLVLLFFSCTHPFPLHPVLKSLQ